MKLPLKPRQSMATVTARWALFTFVLLTGVVAGIAWIAYEDVFCGHPAADLTQRIIQFGSLFTLAGVLGALLLAQRTARPLMALTARAQALETGDFDSPFPKGGPQEVMMLSSAMAKMAQSVRASELRIRSVLDNALDAVVGMDSRGITIDWSQRAEHMFGWSLAEAVGQPLHELIIPEHLRNAHRAGLEHFLATGDGPVLNRRIELAAVHRDGRIFPIELTVSPLQAEGSWIFYGFVRDLSARQRAEASSAFMIEASTLLAETLDFDATIQKVTKLSVPAIADACVMTVGQETSAELAPGLTEGWPEGWLRELVHRNVVAHGALRGVEKVLATGKAVLVPEISREQLGRIAVTHPDLATALDRLQARSCMIVPMGSRGRVVGAIVLLACKASGRRYDASDLALAEELGRRCGVAAENSRLYNEAREAIAVRDEFLSVASHELRTPLSPLLLQTQLIERRIPQLVLDGEGRVWLSDRVTSIRRQGLRIKRLISELLDVVRIRRGELQIDAEPVDLVEVVQEMSEALAIEGGIDLANLSMSFQRDRIVGHWDRLRVQQIIANLLSNAVRHGGNSAISVSVGLEDQTAVLVVNDQGPGIDEKDQRRIFEPLERAAAARRSGGLGLGLYVSRQAVQGMGGTISVHSSPGSGASFAVRLPLAGAASVTLDGISTASGTEPS
ncbi:MAG: ATP-binding protein [Pseudomonadota bacterium]|nr:ATP-binding protein [Pseudomonadota bacterium]